VPQEENIVALGYFVGIGGMPVGPTGAECYEKYPVMRRWCEQVESWTGVEMRSAFAEDHTVSLISGSVDAPDLSVRPDFLYRGSIRQAAHAIGMSDILAEQGIYPDLIAGTSLGGLIAACLSGSIEREDLFRVFARVAEMPLAPDGEPARGIAIVEVPPDADIDWYYGESRPHVNMAAEFEQSGDNIIFMLSGYLKDLESLAAEAPPGRVQVVTGAIGAVHCPDVQFMSDLLEPFLNEISFRDPEIPLLCGVGGKQSKTGVPLKTGDDVRRSILENYVAPVGSFSKIIAAFDEHSMDMVLAVGAALPVGVPPCPFPVLQANVPDDIGQIMAMIYDLGLVVGG
jgi:[acyl-carrier-protein] S-malonyltransferase